MGRTYASVAKGDRWARLTCVGIRDDSYQEELYNANEQRNYYSGVIIEKVVYVLKCDCGRTLELDKRGWEGKRSISDCGCGLASQVNKEKKAALTVSLPISMLSKIEQYAGESNLRTSDAVREIINTGFSTIDELKRMRGEE